MNAFITTTLSLILFASIAHADERKCLEKDFVAFKRVVGIVGPAPEAKSKLPKNIQTRAQFEKYIDE
ncbi:MAG: hypothetical protein ABL927_14345, partial [Bdellovibrionales bacterium]